jgi:hypothetical protein
MYARMEKITFSFKNAVFCDIMPCDSCKMRRFGETYHLHHRGGKTRRMKNNVTRNLLLTLLTEVKRRLLQEPHGVTSQKTAFFLVTAVTTSNLT